MRERRIDTVVLAGLVTNFGVESTGRAADEHGYGVVFLEDAMARLEADAHEFATRRIFPHLGRDTVEELLAGLAAGSTPVTMPRPRLGVDSARMKWWRRGGTAMKLGRHHRLPWRWGYGLRLSRNPAPLIARRK